MPGHSNVIAAMLSQLLGNEDEVKAIDALTVRCIL